MRYGIIAVLGAAMLMPMVSGCTTQDKKTDSTNVLGTHKVEDTKTTENPVTGNEQTTTHEQTHNPITGSSSDTTETK